MLTKKIKDVYKKNNQKAKDVNDAYMAQLERLEKELYFLLQKSDAPLEEIKPHIIASMQDLGLWEDSFITHNLHIAYANIYRATVDYVMPHNEFSLDGEEITKEVDEPIKGKNFRERNWENKAELANRIYDTIDKGQETDKLDKDLKRVFVFGTYMTMRLLQNESSRVIFQAQDKAYKDTDVERVMYLATLDDRTTDICQELDGTIFKMGENRPRIPEDTHVGCRSVYIPIVEDWSPELRRDQEKKENIEFTTYKDWVQQ